MIGEYVAEQPNLPLAIVQSASGVEVFKEENYLVRAVYWGKKMRAHISFFFFIIIIFYI